MKYLNNIKNSLKEVYSNKNYVIISIVIAVILFSLNAILRNISLLENQFSFKLLIILILGTEQSMGLIHFIFLIVLSILGGSVVSFSAYLIKRQIKMNVSATSSVLLAIIAPACPACALSIFSLIGLNGIIIFLPFQGLELSFLSLILIIISMIYLSEKINTTVCEIKN